MAVRGGKREGAGRKRNSVDGTLREQRCLRASAKEWELIKCFEKLIKKDFAKAENLLNLNT